MKEGGREEEGRGREGEERGKEGGREDEGKAELKSSEVINERDKGRCI